MDALLGLSNDLASAVERAARSVVAVHARPHLSSTGIHWRTGVIVTAEHTVRMDADLTITTPEGRSVPAMLAGRDATTDIAILKVDAPELPVADLADAAALKVGHVVLALGRGPAASWGVVSAVGGAWRTWRGGEVDRLLRLDLTLYPGFSGGPLVTPDGRVAGMTTSGLSRHMPLAVPGSTVNRVLEELLERGHIARGYLGVGMQPVAIPDPLRSRIGVAQDAGLIVVSVEPDGPAATAGVLLGDVLLALDGVPVSDPGDVQARLARTRAGATVRVSILRAGALVETTITVGERPRRRARG